VDLASGAESLRPDAGGPGGVLYLAGRSPGHDLILAGDGTGMMQLYSASTDQFGPLLQTPNNGGVFAFSADGQVFVEGTEILDRSFHVVSSVRNLNGGGAVPSMLTPDGQSLFYETSAGLIRARIGDGEVVDRSPLPSFMTEVRITDDGQSAVFRYLTNSSSGQVGVIDLR
jgi:hypothetical protein